MRAWKAFRRELRRGAPLLSFPVLLLCSPASAQDATDRTAVAAAMLPRDLSPWGMFMQADIVVKAVMIGLLFATAVTWTVWLAKTIELIKARRNTRSALRELASARSVDGAVRQVPDGTVAQLIEGAMTELRMSTDRMEKLIPAARPIVATTTLSWPAFASGSIKPARTA